MNWLPRANAGARLDRLPISSFHRRILWLIGIGMFFDGFDIYVAGAVLGATLKSGFSTMGQNAEFVSVTFLGMMLGAFFTGFPRRPVRAALYLSSQPRNLWSRLHRRRLRAVHAGADLAALCHGSGAGRRECGGIRDYDRVRSPASPREMAGHRLGFCGERLAGHWTAGNASSFPISAGGSCSCSAGWVRWSSGICERRCQSHRVGWNQSAGRKRRMQFFGTSNAKCRSITLPFQEPVSAPSLRSIRANWVRFSTLCFCRA